MDWNNKIEKLGKKEKQIINYVIARLDIGQQEYGDWPDDDTRDEIRETLEEVIDGLVYCAARLVKLNSSTRG
jgi:hypothetical protein